MLEPKEDRHKKQCRDLAHATREARQKVGTIQPLLGEGYGQRHNGKSKSAEPQRGNETRGLGGRGTVIDDEVRQNVRDKEANDL